MGTKQFQEGIVAPTNRHIGPAFCMELKLHQRTIAHLERGGVVPFFPRTRPRICICSPVNGCDETNELNCICGFVVVEVGAIKRMLHQQRKNRCTVCLDVLLQGRDVGELNPEKLTYFLWLRLSNDLRSHFGALALRCLCRQVKGRIRDGCKVISCSTTGGVRTQRKQTWEGCKSNFQLFSGLEIVLVGSRIRDPVGETNRHLKDLSGIFCPEDRGFEGEETANIHFYIHREMGGKGMVPAPHKSILMRINSFSARQVFKTDL